MDNNDINVEEILSSIRAEIKDKGLTSDMLSFEDVPCTNASPTASSNSLDNALAYLNANYYVQPYKKLQGNPLKTFFKKVVRKLIKFYVEPIVFQQNNINSNIVYILNDFKEISDSCDYHCLVKRIEKLEKENRLLKAKLTTIEEK